MLVKALAKLLRLVLAYLLERRLARLPKATKIYWRSQQPTQAQAQAKTGAAEIGWARPLSQCEARAHDTIRSSRAADSRHSICLWL